MPAAIASAVAIAVVAVSFFSLNHSKPVAVPHVETGAIIAKANILEHDEHIEEAITLYEKALAQANQENNLHRIAEMQHRIGWNWFKLWCRNGKSKADIEQGRTSLRWIRRAMTTLEPVVADLSEKSRPFSDYSSKRLLTLLAVSYDAGVRISKDLHDSANTNDCANRLVDLYDAHNESMIDRERERNMYCNALDSLIRAHAKSGNLKQGRALFADWQKAVGEHFMDASEQEALTSEYKKLLKLN
jgi:tetratricopeptide (TPR) repeat protein